MFALRACFIALAILSPSATARKLKGVHLATADDPCACQPNGLEKVSGAVIDAPDTPGHEDFVVRKSSSGEHLSHHPADYGESCQMWEKDHEDCEGEYKAAWCSAKWCYVSKECKKHKDVKQSMYFPGKELYYSYNKCGSLDAFTSEACFAKGVEEGCSDPCAWNAVTKSCQNKLCQCTGDNTAIKSPEKYAKNILKPNGKNYGKTCHNWDQRSCPAYENLSKKEGGADLGLWCCKDWCYVSEECPSAKPNSYGLHYSYYACPDDSTAMAQCPWKKPITYDGGKLPLTTAGAKALNNAPKSSSQRAPLGFVGLALVTLTALFLQ